MRSFHRKPASECGSAIMLALVLAMIVALLALGLLLQASLSRGTTGSERQVASSLTAAESGVTLALHMVGRGRLRGPVTFPHVHGPAAGGKGPVGLRYSVSVSDICETAPPSPVLPQGGGEKVYEFPRFTVRYLHLRSQALPASASLSLQRGVPTVAGTAIETEVALWPIADTVLPPTTFASCNGAVEPDGTLSLPAASAAAGVARVRQVVPAADESPAGRYRALRVAFLVDRDDGGDGAQPAGWILSCVLTANGEELLRIPLEAAVPGGAVVLDTDLDGWHDRVYLADAAGSVWRLDISSPLPGAGSPTAGSGAIDWKLTRIFRLARRPADQPPTLDAVFPATPKLVPARVDNGTITWALVVGSAVALPMTAASDTRGPAGRLYYLVDAGDQVTRDESALLMVRHDRPLGDKRDICAIDMPDRYGWGLVLGEQERVVGEITVAGVISLTTIRPQPAHGTSPGDGRESLLWEQAVYTVSACLAEPLKRERSSGVEHEAGAGVSWPEKEKQENDQSRNGKAAGEVLPFGEHHLVMSWRQEGAS